MLTWEEIQAALKALTVEQQERLYYRLEDEAFLSSDELIQALDEYYNNKAVDI